MQKKLDQMSFLLLLIIVVSNITYIDSSTAQRVIVGGASGYIGRQVVKQLVARGITTAALVRSDPSELSETTLKYFQGAEIIKCDVLDATSTDHCFLSFQPTAVICCLASRSGNLFDCSKFEELSVLVHHRFVNSSVIILVD